MTAPDHIGAWAELPFWRDGWPQLARALDADPRDILPPVAQRFAALALTQPDDVRVVVLGQDPYPTPGHAHGLAFSVTPETALPRSLSNIFKEMDTDIGTRPATGDLRPWAHQGVLLLNTALSVPSGEAGGHARLGWAPLIDQILDHVARRPTAFLLWGKHAQSRAAAIPDTPHLKIETAHPSPLSARRGFFGSRPFSTINRWLETRGETPIDWAREETPS